MWALLAAARTDSNVSICPRTNGCHASPERWGSFALHTAALTIVGRSARTTGLEINVPIGVALAKTSSATSRDQSPRTCAFRHLKQERSKGWQMDATFAACHTDVLGHRRPHTLQAAWSTEPARHPRERVSKEHPRANSNCALDELNIEGAPAALDRRCESFLPHEIRLKGLKNRASGS